MGPLMIVDCDFALGLPFDIHYMKLHSAKDSLEEQLMDV